MSKVRTYRIDEGKDALVQAGAREAGKAPSVFVREAAVAAAIRTLTGRQRAARGGGDLPEPTGGADR